jgi:hypothetical protein
MWYELERIFKEQQVDIGTLGDIMNLEKTIQELRTQLATSNEEKERLNESSSVLSPLSTQLRWQPHLLDRKITHLDESSKELRSVLVASQDALDRSTRLSGHYAPTLSYPNRVRVRFEPSRLTVLWLVFSFHCAKSKWARAIYSGSR